MKSLKKIKKELHEYIDSISDERELTVIYENTVKYFKSGSGKDENSENNSLPNCQQKELAETIEQGNSDGNKSEKDLKKSIERWFNDGGRNAC